jgi:hypothetical protein
LSPAELRSLDAIHLATAQQLGEELGALITYDNRMATAAKRLGYRIVQPYRAVPEPDDALSRLAVWR